MMVLHLKEVFMVGGKFISEHPTEPENVWNGGDFYSGTFGS
jgi:hypothetical protein